MLSYRHAFHAGNHADVLKHWVLVMILDSFRKKEKPFLYMDTHSGAGMYSLLSDVANKTGEYKHGISKVQRAENPPEAFSRYLDIVNPQRKTLKHYPGSPVIAQTLLRSNDKAVLCELHPQDEAHLQKNMQGDKRIRVLKKDGFHQLKAELPHQIKRGLVLIDPSYELKSDYVDVAKAVGEGIKRCSTLTYAIWYPIVNREYVAQLISSLRDANVDSLLQIELSVDADSHSLANQGKGMVGSGMLVINAPWQLDEKAESVLPWLVNELAPNKGSYAIHHLSI